MPYRTIAEPLSITFLSDIVTWLRSEGGLPSSPVVKVWRRTETDEGALNQGATTENTGEYRGEEQRSQRDRSPVECSQTFTTSC
jgi:hypothetical protein